MSGHDLARELGLGEQRDHWLGPTCSTGTAAHRSKETT